MTQELNSSSTSAEVGFILETAPSLTADIFLVNVRVCMKGNKLCQDRNFKRIMNSCDVCLINDKKLECSPEQCQ